MTIYQHRASVVTAAGTTSSTTLKVPGGLLRYLLIRATTPTTTFKADLVDENSKTILNFAYHNGEIVDDKICLPVSGTYTINITNASANETFDIIFSVQEN